MRRTGPKAAGLPSLLEVPRNATYTPHNLIRCTLQLVNLIFSNYVTYLNTMATKNNAAIRTSALTLLQNGGVLIKQIIKDTILVAENYSSDSVKRQAN